MEESVLQTGAGRAQRCRGNGLHILKEALNSEMARCAHENVLAKMLEKVLAFNISQIVRAQKLSEPEQMQRPAA